MSAKCVFCDDTKQEPGIDGPCVWCEEVAVAVPPQADAGEVQRLRDQLTLWKTRATRHNILLHREIAETRSLRAQLGMINQLIYAVGAPLGSDVYFSIREICAPHHASATASPATINQKSEGEIPDFSPGNGNKARRRAEALRRPCQQPQAHPARCGCEEQP